MAETYSCAVGISKNEQMVEIPVKQYAEAIMAIQKLADVKAAVWTSCYPDNDDVSNTILEVIRSIVGD